MDKMCTLSDLADRPYFLTNKKWYYEDKEGKLQLTPEAPPKAVKSYDDFFKKPEFDKNGIMTLL